MRAKFLLFCAMAAFCLTTTPASRADAEATFARANTDYAAGHFGDAIAGYESLVKNRQWNATLFYDLGNAYFRAQDLGRAILSYERAAALDPAQPEARANLRLARDQARALALATSWPEAHLDFLTLRQFAWVAAVAFWGCAFIIAGLSFARRRPVVWIFALLLLGAICAGSLFAIYAFETGSAGRGFAIVTGKNIQARVATAENAASVVVLPAGSEVKILSKRGNWIYAALPSDLRGWVPADSAEAVRL
jgi:tetratricopeptide (TPR) repeat protein